MKNRLLIADDQKDSAETLAMLLRMEGFDVEVAYDGQQALETALTFRPDILILDLNMPALDGFQVAGRLRALPQFAHKQFVALTGYGDQQHLDAASKLEFDEYLVKPCKLNLLMTILTEAAAALEA